MTDRPILFSGPMVRALLEGRKTVTRRIVNPQPPSGVGRILVGRYEPAVVDSTGELGPGPEVFGAYDDDGEWGVRCPYGEPGDRLWVRETWYDDNALRASEPRPFAPDEHIDYRATHNCRDWEQDCPCRGDDGRSHWRPSIHMPRWASRITLAVTSVRVERLQAITDDDVAAEGLLTDARAPHYAAHVRPRSDAACHFAALWDVINRERAPWASNPWVWVVGFEVVL